MIECEFIAIKSFIAKLGNTVIDTNYLNHRRHAIIRTVEGKKYYLIFKRDFFHTFYKQFPKYIAENPDVSKVGESLNLKYLLYALDHKIEDIIFIYPNSISYFINPNLMWKIAKKHKLIRTQKESGERTTSVPISFLKNWDKREVEKC